MNSSLGRTWLARTAVILLLLSGCATTPATVPLEGSPAEWSTLAGRWEGAYESAATGRTGSIVFELTAGEDHAHGDVLMIPRGSDPYGPPPRAGEPAPPGATSRLLKIRFVRSEAGTVSGTLDPYWDPDCECEVSTTFVGKVTGDSIAGTFTSVRQAGRVSGTWKATRKTAS